MLHMVSPHKKYCAPLTPEGLNMVADMPRPQQTHNPGGVTHSRIKVTDS